MMGRDERHRVLLVGLGLALSIAGCTHGSSNPIAASSPAPSIGTTGATSTETFSPTPAQGQPGSSAAPSHTAQDYLDGHGVNIETRSSPVVFVAPSRNIGCAVSDDKDYGVEARCDIRDHAWHAPPKPANCELDWGQGLRVNASAGFVCASDTVLVGAAVLAYGHGIDVGRFRCVSAVDGVRCVNRQNRHGFWISRDTDAFF